MCFALFLKSLTDKFCIAVREDFTHFRKQWKIFINKHVYIYVFSDKFSVFKKLCKIPPAKRKIE